jgi:hypothetical protein
MPKEMNDYFIGLSTNIRKRVTKQRASFLEINRWRCVVNDVYILKKQLFIIVFNFFTGSQYGGGVISSIAFCNFRARFSRLVTNSITVAYINTYNRYIRPRRRK